MNDGGPYLVDADAVDEAVARRFRVAGDMPRRFETRQDALGHQPEWQRPALGFRLEHGAERIQIVARHQRARRRQRVHEVCVTVIDNVEHVELIANSARQFRIVAEPIDETVRNQSPSAGGAGCTNPAAQRRANKVNGQLAGMIRLQPVDEHVGHQVHARPSLLEHVRDDRHTKFRHATSAPRRT